jgi:hypothetical protein
MMARSKKTAETADFLIRMIGFGLMKTTRNEDSDNIYSDAEEGKIV